MYWTHLPDIYGSEIINGESNEMILINLQPQVQFNKTVPSMSVGQMKNAKSLPDNVDKENKSIDK